MENDRWFSLLREDLSDIPARINVLKRQYIVYQAPSLILIFIGLVMMFTTDAVTTVLVGCFLGLAGVVWHFTFAALSYLKLCYYRLITEIKSSQPYSSG